MSEWSSVKAKRVLKALESIGWKVILVEDVNLHFCAWEVNNLPSIN